jgi:hypothetical protein
MTWKLKSQTDKTITYERQAGNLYQSIELEKELVAEIVKDSKTVLPFKGKID